MAPPGTMRGSTRLKGIGALVRPRRCADIACPGRMTRGTSLAARVRVTRCGGRGRIVVPVAVHVLIVLVVLVRFVRFVRVAGGEGGCLGVEGEGGLLGLDAGEEAVHERRRVVR